MICNVTCINKEVSEQEESFEMVGKRKLMAGQDERMSTECLISSRHRLCSDKGSSETHGHRDPWVMVSLSLPWNCLRYLRAGASEATSLASCPRLSLIQRLPPNSRYRNINSGGHLWINDIISITRISGPFGPGLGSNCSKAFDIWPIHNKCDTLIP